MVSLKYPELSGEKGRKLAKEYPPELVQQNIRQSRIFVLLLSLFSGVYIFNDFQFLAGSSVLVYAVSFRGLFMVLGIVLFAYMYINKPAYKPAHKFERYIFAWALLGTALYLFINFTRPANYTGQMLVSILIISMIYMVFPLSLLLKAIPAVIFTAGNIVLVVLLRESLSVPFLIACISTLVVANIVGIIVSLNLYSFQLSQYIANLNLARQTAERERAEKVLAESEAKLSALFFSTNDLIWSVDPERFGLQTYNEAFTKYLSEKGVINTQPGMTPEEMAPAGKAELWKNFYRQALREGSFRTEYEATSPTDFFNLSFNVLKSKDRVFGVSVFGQNITDIKKSQEALKASEERYRSFFENSFNAVLLTSLDGSIQMANQEACRLFGMTEEEIIQGGRDVIVDRSDPRLLPALETRARTLRFQGELRLRRKDGTTFEAEISTAAFTDTSGKRRATMIIRDITERKRAEEALRDERWLLRNVIDGAQAGTWEWNVQTGELVINENWVNIVGYTLSELTPVSIKTWNRLAHPDDVKKAEEMLERHFAGQITHSDFECRMKHKAGHWVWIHDRGQVMTRTPDGKPLMMFGIHMDITGRKQAEEALQEREQSYRLLAENARDVIWTMDADYNFTYISPSIEYLRGLTVEEAMHEPFADSLSPESGETVNRLITKIIASDVTTLKNNPVQVEVQQKRKDHSLIWVEMQVQVLINENGQIAGYLGISRDINERKKAEIDLREHQKKYQDLIETTSDFIWEIDNQGKYTYCSPQVKTFWGHDPEDMIGKSPFDKMLPGRREEAASTFMPIFKAARPFNGLQASFLNHQGNPVTVEISAVPFFAADGTLSGYRGISRDITERKKIEEALRESEEKYRLLHENAGIGIAYYRPDGMVISYNKLAASYMNGRPEDFVGKSVHDIFPGPEASLYLERIKNAVSSDNPVVYEDLVKLPAGNKYLLSTFTKICNAKDDILGIQIISQDITAGKRAEEERLSMERKAEVNARLASLGEMAAGIAHEINNPLTPVIFFADLLMERDLPPDVKEDIGLIRDNAKRTADVTRRLLAFAGQNKPLRKLCSLNEIIEATLALRAYSLKTNGIKVMRQLDPELPQTIADAGQIQQVMLNIIMNAEYEMIKSHGGGNLLIKTENAGQIIRVSVKDDGPGILKENLDKLFIPFFTTKKVGEGTGLGLPVCHGIITEHNGRIYAESEEGEGATFIVELPIVTQLGEEQTKPSGPAAVEAGEAVQSRILVVDDEPAVVQVLQRVLEGKGHDVKAVSTAEEALELIKIEKYQLILLDIKLPDMSGIEMYRHLEKRDQNSVKRIIFITGDVMGKDTLDFFSRTGVAYISKPFEIEQLKKLIESKLLL